MEVMMEVPFTYNTLTANSIRLFSISDDREVTFNLTTYDLDSAPDFYALSYVWGSDTLTDTIICNGQAMKIASNLHRVIQSLQDPRLWLEAPIWIDAISINQTDNAEKAEQVGRMGDIYRRAKQVWVWLGPSENNSDLAMDAIEDLLHKLSSISSRSRQFPPSGLNKHGLPGAEDYIWPALLNLYRRKWFGRLWTFQEVTLGAHIIVMCGYKCVDWRIFSKLAIEMMRLGLDTFVQKNVKLESHENGFQAVQHIELAREMMALHNHLSFIAAIKIADTKQVTDPRDRIYGMLGLTSEALRERIEVSYDLDVVQTWIRVATAFIESSGDRALIILELGTGRTKLLGLPSWCPNFNSSQGSVKVFGITHHAGTLDNVQIPVSMSVSRQMNSFSVTGFRVDVISQVIDGTYLTAAPVQQLIDWEKQCSDLARIVYKCDPDSTPLEHIYTLTLNTQRTIPQEQEGDVKIVYGAILNRLQRAADHGKTKLRPVSPDLEDLYSEVHRQILSTCSARKYFCTNSGRVGIGPPGIQTGDIVVVLYGSAELMTLRPRSTDRNVGIISDIGWVLMGETYVHGLMDLEETKQIPGLPVDEIFEMF